MPRNRIQTNTSLFNKVKSFLNSKGESRYENVVRYIKMNPDERQWLDHCTFPKNRRWHPRISSHLANLNHGEINETIFIFCGSENMDVMPEYMTGIDPNSGIYAALIVDKGIPLRRYLSPLKIVNETFGDESANYAGNTLEEVSFIFENVNMYSLSADYILDSESITKITSDLYLCNPDELNLDFSNQTIEAYKSLIRSDAANLPYEYLISSLISLKWEHAYLDLYRCIERLYPKNHANALKDRFSLSQNTDEIAAILEAVLGWKAKEAEALEIICRDLPEELRFELQQVINSTDMTGHSTHKFLYRIRNSYVHNRSAEARISISDEVWDNIIRALLKIVTHLYSSDS